MIESTSGLDPTKSTNMSDQFIPLASDFYVSPQITAKDIAQATELGVTLIISNRPDDEEPDQPQNAALEIAALAAGIKFERIPVDRRGVTKHHIEHFKKVMAEQEGPVLAFCRSGTRSTMLRAFVKASEGEAISDIVRQANSAGYDLYTIVPGLEAVAPEKRKRRR